MSEPEHTGKNREQRERKDESGTAASRWRLFYAIELPEEIRHRAAAHSALLRASLPQVRASWDRPEKLHLTLKFFGEVAEGSAPALSRAAEQAAQGVAPFPLVIADAGAFPPHGTPRVLWLGLRDPTGELARLQQSLEGECSAAGFKREERPFHPHITLARLRHPAGARELAALHQSTRFPALEFMVAELVLMRSQLGPGGSRYTRLTRHSLSG